MRREIRTCCSVCMDRQIGLASNDGVKHPSATPLCKKGVKWGKFTLCSVQDSCRKLQLLSLWETGFSLSNSNVLKQVLYYNWTNPKALTLFGEGTFSSLCLYET